MVVPDSATPVPNPPFTYWVWPELVNEGITPIVRVHITTWEDPDAECDCLLRPIEDEGVQEAMWEALNNAREEARRMLWEESGWIVSGNGPGTEFSCSHDIDPRNGDDYYVT